MIIQILEHKIDWWLDDESITELDERDIEHIQELIAEGYREGEINHGPDEIRGWWKIINN